MPGQPVRDLLAIHFDDPAPALAANLDHTGQAIAIDARYALDRVLLERAEAARQSQLHLVRLLDILEHDHAVLHEQRVDLVAQRLVLQLFTREAANADTERKPFLQRADVFEGHV